MYKLQILPVLIFIHFFCFSIADLKCDYQQDLVLGQEYYIYNQEYPALYPRLTACRWNAKSPPGTVVLLSCNDVDIPPSRYCQSESLLISTTGNQYFDDARYFCGKTSFTMVSERNFLSIGLFAGYQSRGGRFLCSLAAVQVAPGWCTCSKQPYSEESKIMGGQETRTNEFPWMAALVDASSQEAFCGASIISDRYALTAAHCLLHQTPDNLGLLVGDHDLIRGDDTAAAAIYRISNFTKHPFFNSTDESNDIAVLKTNTKIKFSTAVGAVCLPFKYGANNFERQSVTDLGWGFMNFGGDKADTLQKVNLSVVSNFYCEQAIQQRISGTQICTWGHRKDACFSDSGGPVLWKSPKKRYFLVGIISFGIACGTNVPGVNTRVTSFLSWIVSVTSDSAYCFK